MKKLLKQYRAGINPPYNRRDLVHIVPTLIILLAIPLTLFLVSHQVDLRQRAAESQDAEALNQETLSELNLRNLSENEYAVIKKSSEKKLDRPTTQKIFLSNGQTLTFNVDTETTIEVIEGKAGINTYLPANSADIRIHSNDEITEEEAKEAVDPAVGRKLESPDDIVPVIIQFSLPFERFYENGQASSRIAEKQARFEEIKQRVQDVLTNRGKIKRDLKIINGVSADINSESLEKLARSPFVKKIELDREVKAFLDTSVDEIKVREVWPIYDQTDNPLTGAGRRIAVVDTGVDYTHPDLGGCLGVNCKVIGGYDFVNNDADPMDDQGHGTHVAGTAAGKGIGANGQQLWGVAPDAKIYAYKVLNSGGSGSNTAIIAAMNASVDPNGDGNNSDRVDVATLSLGGIGNPDDSMSLAADNGAAAGVVFTIAAGNSGPSTSTIASPGTSRTAITVAAACKSSQIGGTCASPIAQFSSRGPVIWNGVDIKKPDIAAPGVLICAARWSLSFANAESCFDDKHIRISGTSMATPHIAGVAALVRQANPSWTPLQVKDWLKSTSQSMGGTLTYNDQGAGLVNVKSAIPFAPKAQVTPDRWNVTTDPSKKVSTSQQLFSVTPTDPSINSLSISVEGLPSGITITPSKQILQVTNRSTDTFSVTLSVDNDVAAQGAYLLYIYFSENGVKKAGVPIFLAIKPTYTVAPEQILDYGNSDPSLSSWTSQPLTLTVTNLRTDSPQTVTIASTQFPAGITYQAPQSITVPAATATAKGVASVTTTMSVDNAQVANNFYKGTLTLKSKNMTTILHTKLSKFYLLSVQYSSNPDDHSSYYPEVYATDGIKNVYYATSTNPRILYLPTPGTYHAVISYLDKSLKNYHIFKENISVNKGLTTISVNRNEAVYSFNINGTDRNGNLFPAQSGQSGLVYTPNPNLVNSWTSALGSQINGNMFSAFSTNFKYHQTLEEYSQPVSNIHAFYGKAVGMQSAVTITNTPADLKQTQISFTNDQQNSNLVTAVYTCIHLTICGSGWKDPRGLAQPVVQNLYSTLPSEMPYHHFMWDDPITIKSPEFSNENPPKRWLNHWDRTPLLPQAQDNKLYPGLGPSYFSARFSNDSQIVNLYTYPSVLGKGYSFIRQDYSLKMHSEVPYSIWRNGAQVVSGVLPAHNVVGDNSNLLLSKFIATSGIYEFRIDFPYKNRGIDLVGKVRATFDTTSSTDRNPPSIKRLYYYAGTERAEVYDAGVLNRVEFEFDPIGGTMGNVIANYSTDGVTFQPLSVTSGQSGYSASLPQLTNVSKLSIEIKGSDISGNTLSYTFQMPSGKAVLPPPPTATPTPLPDGVIITNPQHNSTVAKGAVVPVTAAASSSTPITKVDIYQFAENNGKRSIICSDNTAPYSCNWNVPTGGKSSIPYQIYAYMYSASGYLGGGNSIRVTAVNSTSTTPPIASPTSVEGDSTPPTINITSPLNGSTVNRGSTLTIAANATDDKGVSKVEISVGGKLLCTDTNTPYSCSWKVPNKPGSSYTISAKATDVANKTTQTSISVTSR